MSTGFVFVRLISLRGVILPLLALVAFTSACFTERTVTTPLGSFHVLANALCSKPLDTSIGITLTTQFSVDRFDRFLRLLKAWPGLISAAVIIKSKDDVTLLGDLVHHLQPSLKAKLTLSIVTALNETNLDLIYPINLARNVAIEEALDPLVLICDVDLVVSPQLLPDLPFYALHIQKDLDLNRQMAFVMPVFEVSPRTSKTLAQALPSDKRDFFRKFMDNVLIPLHENDCEICHNSTDYIIWFHKDRSYFVNYTIKYEPYVIVRKDSIPRFDERFGNYGWSKISWHFDLNRLGFKYQVLPYPFFLIHDRHELSKYRLQFGQIGVKKAALEAWTDFQKERKVFAPTDFFNSTITGRFAIGSSPNLADDFILLLLLGLVVLMALIGLIWLFFPKLFQINESHSITRDRGMISNNRQTSEKCSKWNWCQFISCLLVVVFSIAWIYAVLQPKELDAFEGVSK